MTEALRANAIESGARSIFYSGERTKGLVWESINDDQRRFYMQLSRDALDGHLDAIEGGADDASDVMAREVGDYWTHQTRRALDGLIAVLRGDT